MIFESCYSGDHEIKEIYMKVSGFLMENNIKNMETTAPALMLHVIANYMLNEYTKYDFLSDVACQWDSIKKMIENGQATVRKHEGVEQLLHG